MRTEFISYIYKVINLTTMAPNSSGPQLNSVRDNYNKLVSKRVMASKSKKVQWESRRRFSNI